MPIVQPSASPAACTTDSARTRRSWHPLEMIPFFTRWAPSPGRDFIYAFIWNTLMAVIFTAFAALFADEVNLPRQFGVCFIFAQFIGYAIYVLYIAMDLAFPNAPRRHPALRWAYFFVIPTLGVFIGYWLAATVLDWNAMRAEMFTARGMLSIFMVSVIITGILVAIFIPRERAAQARVRAALDVARANAAEKEATLARMQLLEAQIEPHFLYNTLAHVVSLIDAEPAVAKRMLDRLIVLLRATAASANRSSTLGAQLDLLRAYLDIIALRMGPRLAWSIDVAPELAALPVPPMLLQPVVENAIKHGLEPKIAGGRVDVTARCVGGALELTVADTGLGVSAMRDTRSTGLGLPNLRARLAALYDTTAALVVADNEPSGTRVTISIPVPGAA
ncbi:MAG: histidine kinase [Casimicrobiaceae bacterium]